MEITRNTISSWVCFLFSGSHRTANSYSIFTGIIGWIVESRLLELCLPISIRIVPLLQIRSYSHQNTSRKLSDWVINIRKLSAIFAPSLSGKERNLGKTGKKNFAASRRQIGTIHTRRMQFSSLLRCSHNEISVGRISSGALSDEVKKRTKKHSKIE